MDQKIKDYPLNEKKFIYLDFNSTTPLAPEVINEISHSLKVDWANPSSDSPLGVQARQRIEHARDSVAKMINAPDAHDIIFTSGGTESNNMAIMSAVEWGKQHESKPHIILSNVEHVATTMPIRRLASKGIANYTEVPVNQEGCLESQDVIDSIRPETVLITIMMANNETGVIFPIADISRKLKAINQTRTKRVWLHVDAAQAIGKVPVDVQELGVDYLTIVGHKFYAPRIGALYVRKLPSGDRVVTPIVWGGGQEHGLRPGTENTPMIAGLGRAAQLVSENLDEYYRSMRETRDYLVKQLQKKTSCVLNCSGSPRLPNTASVSWRDCLLSGYQLLEQCPSLVASTTAACHDQTQLSEVLLASGVSKDLAFSTVRLSVGRSTTFVEIDRAVEELVNALQSPLPFIKV